MLKTIGASVVGLTALTGSASAGDTGDERKGTYTWGGNDLWEMLASEPPTRPHPVHEDEVIKDSEGNEEAHEPLWVVGSMFEYDIAGSEHSPHIGIRGHPILALDHVITFAEFNPQWHVHFVVDPNKPFVTITFPDGSTGQFPNVMSEDQDGQPLTSASRIRNATNVLVLETKEVFTCPVRPHKHK